MECTSECCSEDADSPYQLKLNYSSSKRKQEKQMHCFRYEWYRDHGLVIILCATFNSVLVAKVNKLLQIFGSITEKRLSKGFKICQAHKEAVLKVSIVNHPSVASLLSQQLEQYQTTNRLMFMKLLSSLRLLVHQGLALRGHTEDLIQVLKCRCEDVPGLDDWLHKS